MAKINTKNIFNHLKRTLLESGYEVILTRRLDPMRPGPVAVLRFRKARGYIVPDQLKIFINQNIGVSDRVVTLIHELLHEIYPAWTEAKVERVSKQVFRDLAVPQLGFLQFFVMTKPEIHAALKGSLRHSPVC